jgi:transporter family-2 protein
MMQMKWLSFPVALFAGAIITLQTGANSRLKQALDQPMPAVMINYIVGFVAIMGYTLATRVSMPSIEKAIEAPWWAWIGGSLAHPMGSPQSSWRSLSGLATLTALVVTGQLLCSVLLDHFGWCGFEIHPANGMRVAGCVLMVGGLG